MFVLPVVKITCFGRPYNSMVILCRFHCFEPLGCRLNPHMALQWRHNGRDGISNHQPRDCLLNRLFRRRSKKTSKLHVTGLGAGNSPLTGELSAPKASNAENVSIWWRHHGNTKCSGKNRSVLPVPADAMGPFIPRSPVGLINTLGPRQMAAIFLTTFSNAFSWMK